jgi:hypothetical protein
MEIKKNIKTNCGEMLFIKFNYIDNKISVELDEQGSRFLSLLKNFVIKIIHNKPLKYTERMEKIFWKKFPLALEGKKRMMAEEILFELKSVILSSCQEARLF